MVVVSNSAAMSGAEAQASAKSNLLDRREEQKPLDRGFKQ